MNLNKLYAATGVLAALAAVTYFVKNSGSEKSLDPKVGHPLVLVSEIRGVQQIVVNANSETLTFEKADGNWTLDELYDLPVSMDKLGRTVMDSLTDSKVERLVSAKPERIKELGFTGNKIEFLDENGKTLVSVELGRATDNGKQLVKLAGEEKAYLIGKTVTLEADANAWVDKKLLSFESSKVRSASFRLQNGDTLSVARETESDAWTSADALPEGKVVDPAAITRNVNRFTNLSFVSAKPKDAPEVAEAFKHAHRITIGLEGGKTYDITIGRTPEVKVMKEVETQDANGEPKMENKEVVETPAGPVFATITSSDPADPINKYMEKAAYEISAYTFTSLPKAQGELLKDAPKPPPPPPPAAEPAAEANPSE